MLTEGLSGGSTGTAFLLTALAVLSTGIGSAIAFLARRTNTMFLSVSLGFSAGVMIYVSFMEILPGAVKILGKAVPAHTARLDAVIGFFAGMAVVALIDRMVPQFENPHEPHKLEELTVHEREEQLRYHRLMRMGILSALAIGIHNFPEGLATFIAGLQEPSMGIVIAAAIAIHNIPEGIAVSVPIFYATGSRRKAFFYSFLSGLAEPAGALVGYLILLQFMNQIVYGLVFAGVAGIMVFISFDELLPSAEEYGEHHHALYGLIAGMAVMAGSLLLF